MVREEGRDGRLRDEHMIEPWVMTALSTGPMTSAGGSIRNSVDRAQVSSAELSMVTFSSSLGGSVGQF